MSIEISAKLFKEASLLGEKFTFNVENNLGGQNLRLFELRTSWIVIGNKSSNAMHGVG